MRTAIKIALILAAFPALVLSVALVVYFAWRFHENKAGAQKLQDTLTELRALGDPTDFKELIPPPIPDANNLAAIDLFKLEYDPDEKSQKMTRLKAALQTLLPEGTAPRFGNYIKGEEIDADKFSRFLTERFQKAFPHQPAPASALAKLDALCPALAELRSAAVQRQDCRFDRDYSTDSPFKHDLGDVTALIKLAQATNLHAFAALESGNPDIALQDIHAALAINAGLRKEPILISGLVAVGVFSLQEQSIWEGLERHAWNDAQLVNLQAQLESIDFLADGQLSLRGDSLGYVEPIIKYLKDHQYSSAALVLDMSAPHEENLKELWADFLMRTYWYLTVPGDFDFSRAKSLDLPLREARESTDPKTRRAFPEAEERISAEVKQITWRPAPDILLRVALGTIMESPQRFWLAQYRVDATRIACAIERYRLAHGTLPKTLDDLASYTGAMRLPKDLFTGEAYRYRLRPDSTFLLYSVGQDETDDQGKIIKKADDATKVDYVHGDWVWPQPGHPGT